MRKPKHLAALLLAAALALPLLWSFAAAAIAGIDAAAWTALFAQPQTAPALRLSLYTGVAASALALWGTALLLALTYGTPRWGRLLGRLPAMLALPHAAFAIGLLLLIAPSGWLVRMGAAMVSPLNTWLGLGLALDAPPDWQSTQDPWGLGLIAVLALKEIPFLLWAAAAQLQRPDVARRLRLELRLAQSLGYSARSAWWRVAWPQLRVRLQAPLLAVLVYSLTVVDVALLAGPGTPPTLAVLAWQWLQDADPARNAMGAAAAWLLAAVLAALALAGLLAQHAGRGWAAARHTRGVAPEKQAKAAIEPWQTHPGTAVGRQTSRRIVPRHSHGQVGWGVGALSLTYAAVAAALALGSVIGVWPFPALWPQAWTLQAWQAVADSANLVWATLALALASSAAALLWTVAWLEYAPLAWQRRLQGLWYLPLFVPAVLWALGLHRLALAWGIDGAAGGLWLAHTLCVLPYVLLSLQGPYGGFDARLQAVAASLGRRRWPFVWRIKWPLLRAALAASFAVGFAVSVAQYLPTLYVGAGRFASVTTEAIALAAGGQRSLTAAFAALQSLLPALVFGLAAWAGRARRFAPTAAAAPAAADKKRSHTLQ
jgi:putative thiamine transport system permease protein